MMVAIFATMSLGLVLGRLGSHRLALACVLVCLALSTGLFLYEIHSPDTGFRMPWLQVTVDRLPSVRVPGLRG